MKRLSAVRLVNWYHFRDQTFRFDGNVLLLGDNGSGKSTVLDAIQYALVADAGEVRFNQAANESSKRNLYGYVRHKLGSEDTSRPGAQRFGRPGCTAYVLLEFTDTDDPTASFSCGAVLEAQEADTQVDRHHFVVPRLGVAQLPVIGDGDVPLTSKQIRARMREVPSAKVAPDVATYRDELRHRLGTLGPSFHRLLVRAAAFRPIGQVRQFVFDYLLDERPVNTEALQANLENYKRLAEEAESARRRIESLEAILALGERLAGERRTAELHRYLSMRGAVEAASEDINCYAETVEAARMRTAGLEAQKLLVEDQQRSLSHQRESIIGLLAGLPAAAELRRLERERERLSDELERSRESEAEARRILGIQREALELLGSESARCLRRARPELFEKDEVTGIPEPTGLTGRLMETLSRDGALSGRDTASWTRRLSTAVSTLDVVLHVAEAEATSLRHEGKELQQERDELQRGRHRYGDGVEALLHLLRAKLKTDREPQPLCELIDVRDERWRDAVEGYLNTRRFDVVVAPADFSRALQLYEKNKRGYALPGRPAPIFISNVGLVDIERVLSSAPRHAPRSLAAQIATEDTFARAYCDFLMGEVICVDSEQDLRRYPRAITDSVMVYQSHAARQTDRRVYERHFVGAAARARRLDELDRTLARIAGRLLELNEQHTWIERARKQCQQATSEVGRLGDLVEEAARLLNHKQELAQIEKQLRSIDRGEIEKLDAEKKAIDVRVAELVGELGGLNRQLGEAENEGRHGAIELEKARSEHTAREAALAQAFGAWPPPEVEAMASRYAEERSSRSPPEIQSVFERQRKGMETKLENLTTELVKLKATFANDYGYNGDAAPAAVSEHERERDLWRDSRLVEYQEAIAKARTEAIEQLAEDIIFKLRENLLSVERNFEELNRALKDVHFGSDRYSFVKEVAADHRPFYDLIVDAGRFEKDSLFAGQDAVTPTKRTLEDLWDRLLQNEAQQVKSELESRADYRQYFDYDLKIHHADGSVSLFDRVAGDKSGGETQTPFYIAILASMSRLYRHASAERKPSCGVVLLDEAFSKMDETRISAVLDLSRAMGLQLVLATPKERSELVAPRVETSLYIHKDPVTGDPVVLDFTKELHADDAATAGQERAPHATAGGA